MSIPVIPEPEPEPKFTPKRKAAAGADEDVSESTAPLEVPEDLKSFWKGIVNEMIQDRPLVGNHFQDTQMQLGEGKYSEIEILFSKEARYSFVESDKPLVKYVKNKITDKIKGTPKFNLKILFQKIEEPEGSAENLAKSGLNNGPAEIVPQLSEEEWIEKEPIVGFILDKFEGSILL